MKLEVNVRGRIGRILVVLLLATPIVGGHAAAEERGGWKGWTPSLSIAAGIMSTGKYEGSVSLTDSMGIDQRDPNSGEDFLTSPIFEVSLGLATPVVLPYDGRVFVSADLIPVAGFKRNIASEGADSPLEPPETVNFPASAVAGQGLKTQVRTNALAWGFTLGVEIPFELGGYDFRVKPAASWMTFEVDVDGRARYAEKNGSVTGNTFRAVVMKPSGKIYLNGFGPSLEVESVGDRFGPFHASFFARAAGYRIVGDRTVNMTQFVSFNDAFGIETYEGRWRTRAAKWAYRVNLGVRIHLQPGRGGTDRKK